MGVLTFLNNLRYLSRYDIKTIYKDIKYLKGGLDYLKYEIQADLKDLFTPKILTTIETVERIINNRMSISRFGDGEFLLIKGVSIPFQKSSNTLSARLEEVLTSTIQNLDVGLAGGMCVSTKNLNEFDKNFIRTFWGNNIDWIMKLIDRDRVYANSGFTILPDSQEKYEHIRAIWKDRDITVICGDRVFKKVKYNVFDNAKSVEYQYAPTINAFEEYDKILARAQQIDKNRLVCIILGPTATVLAYDLTKTGYQALDLGHIVKSYDAFMQNHNLTPDYLHKFFAKD